jgi:hypothetical protein
LVPPEEDLKVSENKGLSELVEQAVDRGAKTAEEIHLEIANLPITVLENLGLEGETSKEIRRIQDASIGAVYEVIRKVNHKVAELAQDLLYPDEPSAS